MKMYTITRSTILSELECLEEARIQANEFSIQLQGYAKHHGFSDHDAYPASMDQFPGATEATIEDAVAWFEDELGTSIVCRG
jgi:hypothetical protein